MPRDISQRMRLISFAEPESLFCWHRVCAVNSAMTGHLVLSTLHTNNAASTLPRLIDMNIEPFLIASTVNVIIAQRLVRRICEKCKVSFEQPPGELFEKYPIEMTDKLFAFENRDENIKAKANSFL